MQGKKEILSKVMYRAKLLRLLREVRRDILVIFGYHRIVPDGPSFSSLFADDVFGPTASEFEHAIEWFKENVRLLSEAELIELVETKRSPGRLSVLITFDDGYADNYTLAYPILKRHGVPATFFIPSNMIEERLMGWWDLTAYLLKRTARTTLAWERESFRLPEERARAIAFFHKKMQLEKHERTKDLIERLSALLEVELPSKEVRDRELMSWEQLREVSRNGISIGSHTHSHRVLATLDAEAQREEIAASKSMLEEKIGRPVRSIAYPVGGYRHFTEETRRIAAECGYAIGCSFCTGVNRWGAISPFDVKRIGPPASLSLLAGTTILPEVFDWDQSPGYGG